MDVKESSSAQGPSKDCHTIVYDLKFQYPNLKMDGTEDERQELLDLKVDLESWIFSLQSLDDWRFPNKLQEINATNFRIKYWTEKANGRELEDEYKVGVAKDNRELNSEPSRVGPPDENILEHVLGMIERLRTIWSVMSIKYTEAVVKTAESMEERIMRCDGIINFH